MPLHMEPNPSPKRQRLDGDRRLIEPQTAQLIAHDGDDQGVGDDGDDQGVGDDGARKPAMP